jgi:hypothetical protein
MAPGDPGRDGLLAERATSLMWAGRITDAETACRSLLGRDLDPSLEGAVRICLGHVLLAGGQARDGLCELERACQSPLLTGAERAEAQAWASLARLVLADLAGAAAAAAQARPVAVAARDPLTTSVAMVSLAQVSELRGDLGDALRIIDDAVRLADGSPGRLGHRFPVHDFRAYILITLGRLDEANSSLETGMRISEELGTRWALAHYHAGRALERFLAGHWDDAVAEIETDTGLAGAPGESYHHLLVRRGVLSLIRLHRNDLPGARDAVGAAPGELPGTGRATCRPAGPSSGPPPAPAARPASTASSTAEPPASPPPTAPSTPPRCPTATCRSPPRSTQASNDAPASRSRDFQLTEAGIDLAPAAAAARNLRAHKKGITVVQPSNQDLGGVVRVVGVAAATLCHRHANSLRCENRRSGCVENAS